MGLVQKHAILTAVGLLLSIVAVAWLEPNSTGGTTFVVVFLLLVVNALGAIVIRARPNGGEETTPGRKGAANFLERGMSDDET
jgi:hypothetical protein